MRGIIVGHIAYIIDNTGEACTIFQSHKRIMHTKDLGSTIQYYIHSFFWYGRNRVINSEIISLTYQFKLFVEIMIGAILAQNLKTTLTYGFGIIGYYLIYVYLCHFAKTITFGTRTIWRIEGKCIGADGIDYNDLIEEYECDLIKRCFYFGPDF